MSLGLLYLLAIVCVIAAYFIGSIPTGYIVVKKLKGIDIRETGSGSTGATNVKRILGTKWFFTVMLIDALKGILPVFISAKFLDILDCESLFPTLTAIAVVVGHCKPIFLNFKGGKSVATGIGTLVALSPVVGLITAAIWGAITFFSKFVSLGSIIAVCLSVILMTIFHQPELYVWYAAILAIFIIMTHKENIKRLVEDKENKVRK